MRDRQPPLRRQRGVALLTLLAVVALGAALALIAMASPKPSDLKREEITSTALAKAKEALIAYAATYDSTHPNQVPGYLPCPDRVWGTDGDSEGGADALATDEQCGSRNVSVIGRLPWRTLGIAPPRDGSGECLWYAVSGTFKASTDKTELMNWDTLGQIEVYGPDGVTKLAGSQPENRAAAVIFSAGVALGQDRQDDNPGTPRPVCSEDYVATRFLEAVGAINNATPNGSGGAITKFIVGDRNDAFNDRLLLLTPEEIFSAIEKRSDFPAIVAKNAAECLVNYVKKNLNWSGGDFRVPWAARVDDVTVYEETAGRMSGRFPLTVNDPSGATSEADCPDQKNWLSNWKEYLFYALSADFKPTPTPGPPSTRALPITCGSDCLQVNGAGGQDAVVMFAGRPLPPPLNQTRATLPDKSEIANYLEGSNLANHPNTLGKGNYEASACSDTFNDVLYCVALDATTGKPIAAACPLTPAKERRCDFQ